MIAKALVGTTILGLGLSMGIVLGDKYQPITKINEFFKYNKVIADKNTPKDFFNYNIKVEIKDKVATLYLGNKATNKWKRVHENGNVGSVGESIDDFLKETKTYINTKSTNIYDKGVKELETFIQNIKN
jgi:hypothetical protein